MGAFSRLTLPERQFAAAALILLALRIAALVFGHPDLGPDEGQYWFWAQEPAFGYFSKPPFVAWSIAATTGLFGDAEWAVRLSAPLYQTGAAIFLFLLARRLADARAGLYAGLAWLTLPGVFLSSALITTDAPLIFFWSAALLLFFILTDDRPGAGNRLVALTLGAVVGFGFLSKYAMAYFVLGAGLSLIISGYRRRRAGAINIAIAAIAAGAVLTPNIVWNAQHDFQTLSHTAANANWGADFGHPARLFEFLTAQFGVAGPVLLILILAATRLAAVRHEAGERDVARILVAFALPAIAIVTAQSFISRAHANWAAVAYPSAVVLAAIYAARRHKALFAMKASLLLNAALGAGFLAAFASAPLADAIGAGAALKRLRGWKEIGAAIAEASAPYDAIMTGDRETTGVLVYYARTGKPIVAWNSNLTIDSHFEAFYHFDPSVQNRVLFVSERPDSRYIDGRFSAIAPAGSATAQIGRAKTRTLYLFDVSGFVEP